MTACITYKAIGRQEKKLPDLPFAGTLGQNRITGMGKNRTQRRQPHIREWLRHLGIRQKELADRIGMSEAELSRKLNAIRGLDLDWLYRIADALDIRPEELLHAPPDENSSMGIFYRLNDAELEDVAAYARFRLSSRDNS